MRLSVYERIIPGLLIDSEDHHLIDGFVYSFDAAGYLYRNTRKHEGVEKRHRLYLHRQVMNAKPGQFVDHINRNKLDNRRCNLRFVTLQESGQNISGQKTSKSRIRGVHWCQRERCWYVKFYHRQKWHYIGRFKDLAEATGAAHRAASELYPFYSGAR